MIYFDNAATTKIYSSVKEAMMSCLENNFGNPGSPHSSGRKAKAAVEIAREQVAKLLHCSSNDIIFTSGGSEANSIAITGVADYLKSKNKTHLITSNAEHESILNSFRFLEHNGFEVTYLNTDSTGHIIYDVIADSIKDNTGLVSIMFANNELGSINDVYRISDLCNSNDILFHCDCVQAALGYEIFADKFDSCSISSHKIHAPKGVGALYLKDKSIYNSISFGGEQEYGIIPGTHNVAGIVGFGTAAEYVYKNRKDIIEEITYLSKLFYDGLNGWDDIKSFRETDGKIVSVTINGIDAMSAIMALNENGVEVSAGAACSSHDVLPSHVLLAAGMSKKDAASTIRFSFAEDNKKEEVGYALEVLKNQIELLKNLGKEDVLNEQNPEDEAGQSNKPP